MGAEQTLWMYFANAGPVVKAVMLVLLVASIASWTFILQRAWFFKRLRTAISEFEARFWSGSELATLYRDIEKAPQLQGLAAIFCAGFKVFLQTREQMTRSNTAGASAIERAMRIATAHEVDQLDQHLTFLGSVGSISPYVGLLGTVWGIMTAFHALGHVQQATIAMVAPGISEALIATAMGLFAAIPAVLAYNRYSQLSDAMLQQYETFQEELMGILYEA